MANPPLPGRTPALRVLDASVPATPLLQGRVLLHENARFVPQMRAPLDDDLGGIVMTGEKAGERAYQLRASGYDGAMLIDTTAYKTHTATAEEPFFLDSGDLFGTVDTVLQLQKARGASAALTPTGYIPPGASKVLETVIRQAQLIERADTVISLPLSTVWLTDEYISQLIAGCERIPHPKAITLFRQFNPMEQSKTVPANLRRLVAARPDIALLRSDLAALDAFVHGALFSGIGADSTSRHSIPPGEVTLVSNKKNPGPIYPYVLMPSLMTFKGTRSLARIYANDPPATCDCGVCEGRGLDRFNDPGREARRESENHNISTWSDWMLQSVARKPGLDRKTWWRDKCTAAVAQCALENQRLGLSANSKAGFSVPDHLRAWATLPLNP
ncbi:hypothetical protein FGW37_26020 [Streptomyces rectiverticillatus]|uniref:hypothetical protein n=1 Tax=Streptomyces rectiverticillatus TaxID=173860 RepID=UPI0015C334CD|nr:hypothetical protein [Streptomyces rectiverticillatus]QLE76337.1 hypothetical protein FGW37_26020 [Streptomyces rectiverticillatus]